jgi:hypothetical protein
MPEIQPLRPGDPGGLGDYVLAGRLGEGGQGTVFLGRSPDGEDVAVKLLHAVDDSEARARFVRELAVAKQVATFCTAQVLDADVAGDRPYIVSEFIAAPTLQESVAGDGPRGKGALERLAIGTATALTAIHRAGVVHRDFKPANVLLGPDGPRVIDFGIARALDVTGTISRLIGTPSYMAPEQLTEGAVGPPADVFAWGVTMVFAATGRPAFGNDAIPAVMHRIVHDQPDVAALPDSLRQVVLATLTKDPFRRPAAQQLLLWLVGSEGDGERPGPWQPTDPVFTEARQVAAVVQEPVPDGLVPGFDAPPPAGHPEQESAPAEPLRAPGSGNRTLAVLVAALIGLIAGISLIAGPRLFGRDDPANPGPAGAGGPTAPQTTARQQPPSSFTASSGIPAAFAGTWRGTAHNQSGGAFPAEVTFAAGRDTAQVTYSGEAHCTTALTLTGGAPGRIDMSLAAAPSCTPGTVHIRTRSDGLLDYSFTSVSGRYTIEATLARA